MHVATLNGGEHFDNFFPYQLFVVEGDGYYSQRFELDLRKQFEQQVTFNTKFESEKVPFYLIV